MYLQEIPTDDLIQELLNRCQAMILTRLHNGQNGEDTDEISVVIAGEPEEVDHLMYALEEEYPD